MKSQRERYFDRIVEMMYDLKFQKWWKEYVISIIRYQKMKLDKK